MENQIFLFRVLFDDQLIGRGIFSANAEKAFRRNEPMKLLVPFALALSFLPKCLLPLFFLFPELLFFFQQLFQLFLAFGYGCLGSCQLLLGFLC